MLFSSALPPQSFSEVFLWWKNLLAASGGRRFSGFIVYVDESRPRNLQLYLWKVAVRYSLRISKGFVRRTPQIHLLTYDVIPGATNVRGSTSDDCSLTSPSSVASQGQPSTEMSAISRLSSRSQRVVLIE